MFCKNKYENKAGEVVLLEVIEDFLKNYPEYGKYFADLVRRGNEIPKLFPSAIQRIFSIKYSVAQAMTDTMAESKIASYPD